MHIVVRVRRDLRAAADPSRAAGQQAYMKSELPFLGVRVPEVRRVARAAAAGESDAAALLAASRTLWDEANYREERYAAQALLGLRPVRGDRAIVPLTEHMVRTGRWWDHTDELTARMRELHDAAPADTGELVRSWAVDDDLWMRRLAILSQLGRRDRLDRGLLEAVIIPNAADPEFFIRKAIGWALRDYARVDPSWVSAFVDDHPLSALTRREALRHIKR